MSATVRKGVYRTLELNEEFPEQHEQQPGPEAFPLEAISRATVQFPQGPVQIIRCKCRSPNPFVPGIFWYRTIEKKNHTNVCKC